ncbi:MULTISPECIES: DUF5710 domain-containing protein [unclassified Streptomyces]|uniref:DUF5710 domain-containing protein n=1 Tax=unclassified Streptomyces TaxID=2593676 RepID=UPI002E80364F|nr:DUF5710 domain-containing protein [Streptomyces sp. NBC_00562]WUC24863.1 DUF5710 domain-containing protein [Streptomyces sp. NBC_00562]
MPSITQPAAPCHTPADPGEEILLGVDTHKDFHAAAVVTVLGAALDGRTFPATTEGYRQLVAWARSFGALRRAGVECTGSYGAALRSVAVLDRRRGIPVDIGERTRVNDSGRTPDKGREWLDVPYSEKDAASGLGALWDPVARRWYAPEPNMPDLQRWAALPDLPDVLPGEDREFGSGLFVYLVPADCWFKNARDCLSERDWERVRRMVVGRAGHRCEACGQTRSAAVKRWLEVHERWQFDALAGKQILRRLVCLCTMCHTATHFGRAQRFGKEHEALAHLIAVTAMSAAEADNHVRAAFLLWNQRNRQRWALDLSILTAAGLEPVRPVQKTKSGSPAQGGGGRGSTGHRKYRVPQVGGSVRRRGPRPR